MHVQKEYYRPNLERLRLVLLFFMCLDIFGFPLLPGDTDRAIFGFVPIAFFVLSGYLVLQEREDRRERILRCIKRSAKAFGILAGVFFVINLIYYSIQGINIFPAFLSWRFWFNFLVLGVWQFELGGSIWYVQALLYAYIILYFFDKWKLLKLDWLFFILLFLFAVFAGELSGVLPWSILGYNCLPGNFLTRALPYILLGSFIHKKMKFFFRVRRRWYYYSILFGIFLVVIEGPLLSLLAVPGYYGHLIGMPFIAVPVCLMGFTGNKEPGPEKYLNVSRRHLNCIYYFCEPVRLLIVLLFMLIGQQPTRSMLSFVGIVTYFICLGLACLVAFLERKYFKKALPAEAVEATAEKTEGDADA